MSNNETNISLMIYCSIILTNIQGLFLPEFTAGLAAGAQECDPCANASWRSTSRAGGLGGCMQ